MDCTVASGSAVGCVARKTYGADSGHWNSGAFL